MDGLSLMGRSAATARFLIEEPVHTVRIGQTHNEVLFGMGAVRLRFFPPTGGAMGSARPVLISMPLINTWPVFDLQPGHSVLERLTDAGIPVYLVDWGHPGPEDATRPLSYYVDAVLERCFDRARRHAARVYRTAAIDAIGYCVGGTVLAMHLARHPEQAERVALVASPIDFAHGGRLARWAHPDRFPLDRIVDGMGNFPADGMQLAFQCLDPTKQTSKWWGLWSRIDEPGFPDLWAAMEQWSADSVDFPGEAYRAFVRACYFDNALMRGGWSLEDRPVDLSAGRAPAMVISASRDHIAPVASCTALADVWGGPVTTTTIRGGHVGICVGSALPDTLIAWCRPTA